MLSIKKLIGAESLIGFGASLIIGWFLWRYDANETVPFYVVGALISLCGFLLWLIVILWLKMPDNVEKQIESKLLNLKILQIQQTDTELIVILEPNKLLFPHSTVTIFRNINNFDEYVGTGWVTETHNSNGKAQINLIHFKGTITKNDIPTLVAKIGSYYWQQPQNR